MAPDTVAKPLRPGLSLYASLLDTSSNKDSTPGTISRAPVVFKQNAGEDTQQDRAAVEKQQISAGRYQPASCEAIVFANSVGSRFPAFLCIE